MWVYKVIQKPLEYMVGYYRPDFSPSFDAISSYDTEEEAAARVNYLNGGFNIGDIMNLINYSNTAYPAENIPPWPPEKIILGDEEYTVETGVKA